MKKSIFLHLFLLVLCTTTVAAPAFATTYRQNNSDDGWHQGCTGSGCYEEDYRQDYQDAYYYRGESHSCGSGYEWNTRSSACVKQYVSSCSGSYSATSGECYQDRNYGTTYNTYNVQSTTHADVNYYGSCQYVQSYIPDGSVVRANGGVDVYIVKYTNGKKYKRLVLNPWVFNNYPHLSWEQVMNVDRAVVDCFTTSDLVRSPRTSNVYKLYPSGDYGIKRLVTSSAYSRYYLDDDSIYTINGYDEDSYEAGTSLR